MVKSSPVLVTGAHRSGTTWVGRVLMSSGQLGYIDEPFHPRLTPRSMSRRPRYWFEYVGTHNRATLMPAVASALAYRYPILVQRHDVRSPRQAGLVVRNWARAQRYRFGRRRPLIKDPIALFAAEWLADEFAALPIILVRHPAAFVSSVVRLGWTFDFKQWASDDQLMSDLLPDAADDVRRYAREPGEPVESAAFQWKILYEVALRYRSRHPEWHVARHEDLSREPFAAFREMFEYAGLRWSPQVERVIAETTADSNPRSVPVDDYKTVRLNSQAALSEWRRRLSDDAIQRIREITAPVASHFYTQAEW